MTLTQLVYFLQLAEHMSFSRTAQLLHISQPSLSQCISKLEEELDTELFNRRKSGLELTPAGEELQRTAQKVIDELGSMQSKLKHNIYTQLPETFSIYLDEIAFLQEPALTQRFVTAIQTMRKQWPSVRIQVEKFDTNRMEEILGNETADLCIGLFEPPQDPQLSTRYLCAQRMNLVVPRQESWQGGEPTQEQIWEYLRHNQIFMMNYDAKMTSKLIVWLSQKGVVARFTFCTQSWFLQLHLQLKDGAGIVPDHRLYQEFNREDVCVIPIEGLSIDRYIAWNRSNEHFMLPLFLEQLLPD